MTAQGRTGKAGLVTRQELATRLGCHPRSVAKWLDEGAPVAVRGRGGRASLYDEAVFKAWIQAREAQAQQIPDLMVSRARKELAQAIEAEQRVAIKARTLVHVDEVEKAWLALVSSVRAKLLALPTSLSDRLHRVAVSQGAAAVEAALEESVCDVLRELASSKDGGTAPRKTKPTKAKKRSRR